MSIPKPLKGVPTPEEVKEVNIWLNSLSLSKPIRNAARDLSDGVLVAEIISQFHPNIVELHNYQPTSTPADKARNWSTLNMKVFRKLGFGLHPKDIEGCANMTPGLIEKVLRRVRAAIEASPITSRACPATPSRTARKEPSPPTPPRGRKKEMAEAPAPAPRLDPLEELRKQLSDQRQRIADLEQAMETLTLKNSKLEQLVEVKDKKIEAMKRSYVD